MKNQISKTILFVLIFSSSLTHGQQIKHLGVYDGISSGAVRAFQKDSLGYMWIGTSQGLNRYSGYEFKTYDAYVSDGVEDIINIAGNIFVLGSKGQLLQYQYKQDNFKSILSFKDLNFLSIELLNDHTLVIGLDSGLLIHDLESNKTSKLQHPKTRFNRKIHLRDSKVYVASTNGINVYSYLETTNQLVHERTLLEAIETLDFDFDIQNRIWVGTYQKGLFVIDTQNTLRVDLYSSQVDAYSVRSVAFDRENKGLISVEGVGLLVIDQDLNIVKTLKHDPNKLNSLSQNSIYEIFVDDENVYWLGLREIGIDLVYPKNNAFNNIFYVPYKLNSILNNNIRSIYYDESYNVWFGTENGISKLSPNGTWTNYNNNPSLSNKAVLTINKHNNHLVLGVYGSGLIKFNPETGKTKEFPLFKDENKSKLIFATYIDQNEVWVGGIDGPVKHYQNSVLVNSYKTGNARSITSNNGDLMFVGSANGLFEINKRTKEIKRIKNEAFKNIQQIYSLYFDESNNCIWIGNTQGLLSFNLTSKEIKHLNKELNIESGTIFSIQQDTEENLWLGSYSGLWKLNPKQGIIRKFDTADGLTIKSFGFGASTQSSNGRLAFGGPQGAALFSPKDLVSEKEDLNIYVSQFKINGVVPDSTVLQENINFLKKIKLNYNQNSLSFNVETPKLHGSNKQVFSWELKGYDDQPTLSKNSRQAIYSKVPPGAYSLETKVTNVDGELSSQSYKIDIIIKQPFWLSFEAFLCYLLLGFVMFYLFVLLKRSRSDQKFNDNKIKFFTEVAHDIRVPVTLIQLLVSQLTDKKKLQNSVELIKRNTQNLNEYVTQLLDFQKAERGMLDLSIEKVDLKKIIHRTVAEFEPLLIEKSIDISMSIPKVYLWFDETKVSRIFYNLISNAIKYSEDGGQIEIKVLANNKNVQIDFIDNGIGIPEDEQKLLFSRFTRGTNINNKGISGSGIGLMISKKIIELHGGSIEFTSKLNIGSTFSLTLKKGSEHYKEKDLFVKQSEVLDSESIEEGITSNKTLLLVEDNEDLRVTIKFELEKKYTVIDAPNGREALVIALSKNPDLIITDVMMPIMGGKELCNSIKTNFQTSHIPLIMITSLNDVDDKIEGLEIGADAYLEKPFNMKILNAMIANLLYSRQTISQISNSSTDLKEHVKSHDENFLSDVVEIIKKNITNSEFSIDLISEKTGLSRSKLFRKLKGLTNMSPVDLVIKIKLNHASELLKNNKRMRISEVAYASGFNDPKYFSTLFKKFYGKTPKVYSEES